MKRQTHIGESSKTPPQIRLERQGAKLSAYWETRTKPLHTHKQGDFEECRNVAFELSGGRGYLL
jgi:hypothetical protein